MAILGKVLIILLIANASSLRLGMMSMDETFFMPQPMKEKFQDRTIKYQDREGDLVLPWSGGNVESPHIPANYTCPWKYMVVYNANRIPNTILEASCSTEQCGLPGQDTTPLLTSHKCEPIKYFRWVLVKAERATRGKWKYAKRLLPVTVACACTSTVSYI